MNATHTTILGLLASTIDITDGGRQELMLNHLGEVTITQPSQNSWTEHHTPRTHLLLIRTDLGWGNDFWEEYLQDLDDDIVQNEIINYMYINDVITVPVFNIIPVGFTVDKIDSGKSIIGSYTEYHWEMFAVRDTNNKFVGIHSRQY